MKPQLDASSTVRAYIARAQRVPQLTREDEYALAVKVRDTNDPRAASALAEANLRYVVAIAASYRRYGLRLADLVSEGNVGLVTALKKFDPDRGNRFVTYASYWIRAYILDFVLKSWSMVGVGAGPLRSKVFFRLRRERAQIATHTSDPVLANELLAARFGTTPTKIAELAQRLDVRDLSLDAKVHDDGTATVVDKMASPLPSQEDALGDHEEAHALSKCVREAVAGLDARERFIVNVRMMADDPDAMSLAEIGRSLGVSRERARQLEARAKEKLKKSLGACWSGAKAGGEVVALDGGEIKRREAHLVSDAGGGEIVTRTLHRGGKPHVISFDGKAPLLDVVRKALGARATARGCSNGLCGTCRVILDGVLVNACLLAWADVRDGATLETAEDIDRDPAARRALQAFERERPTRCRLCVSGLATTAVDLARRGLARDADAVDDTLATAACMCTGRGSLRRALLA